MVPIMEVNWLFDEPAQLGLASLVVCLMVGRILLSAKDSYEDYSYQFAIYKNLPPSTLSWATYFSHTSLRDRLTIVTVFRALSPADFPRNPQNHDLRAESIHDNARTMTRKAKSAYLQ